MRKIKNIVSILLAFTMIFSMVISPSALVVKDYDKVTSAYGNRAVVMGKAPEYAEEMVTVLLLKGDGTNATPADILYMDTVQADKNGYYEVKLGYKGFEVEGGKVSNCVLRVRAGADDITDSVISAEVKKSDMLAVELETELSATSASAVAQLNNLYGLTLDATVMIAAYDENNKLLGVKTKQELIEDENASISVSYDNVPTVDRLVAFVWDSTSSLIPYMEEKAIEIPNAIKDLVIHPGSDETKRGFTWYNIQETTGAQLQYALKEDYIKDGGFTAENSVIVEGRTEVPYMNTVDLSCKAEIEGLELGTEYVYRVGSAHAFDENVYSFKTHQVEDKQVFAIVSDIHNTMKNYTSLEDPDAAKRIQYTTNIYNSLMKIYPETQFIISAGDNMSIGGNGYEVDDTNKESYRVIQELEMDQLFAPGIFRRVPFISATGNHETMKIGEPHGGVTKYHYNLPNEMYDADGYVIGSYRNTNQNGNWWFRNGDVLVISIMLHKKSSQSAYKSVSAEANKEYIKAALKANPDAKWKILINHVPAYSSVVHTGEEHTQRDLFAELDLDNLGIDAVISGHQHAYSRSKQLLTNKYDDTQYIDFMSETTPLTMMKPKVVEGAIIDGVDANGNQLDVAVDPIGTVHIDVPSVTNRSHSEMAIDFADFIEAHGISDTSKAVWPDQTSIPVADLGDVINVQPPSMLFVTVEKNDDGSEQMKFEYVHSNANTSVESDKFEILDTYIIKKTK